MSNVIDAKARFARRYRVRILPDHHYDYSVAYDSWGGVDQPIPPGSCFFREELSPDRLWRGNRQIGYCDSNGYEHFFEGERPPKGYYVGIRPALPPTALDASGTDQPQYPQDVIAEWEYLRRMTGVA
jgi:hypothetical protein